MRHFLQAGGLLRIEDCGPQTAASSGNGSTLRILKKLCITHSPPPPPRDTYMAHSPQSFQTFDVKLYIKMSLIKRSEVKLKLDSILLDQIFFANLSYFMTFEEIELYRSVIHI
jgi:hypothetical protein